MANRTPRAPKKNPFLSKIDRFPRMAGYVVSFAALIIGFGLLIWQLYNIQVVNGDYWRGLASQNQLKDTTLTATRGEIYDATGKTLASSSIVWDISCDPYDSKGLYTTDEDTGATDLDEALCAEVSAGIARILIAGDGSYGENVDTTTAEFQEQYQYIYDRFSRIDTKYRLLAGKVDMPVAEAVEQYITEFNKSHTVKKTETTPGKTVSLVVSTTKTYKRNYPYGAFAASVIGFCDDAGTGTYGLEKSYDEVLAGVNGRKVTIRNGYGNEITNDDATTYAAQDGYSLKLTLDTNVQEIAERYLTEAVAANNVENRGCAIVMDVNTGAILAMATKPDFDPNDPYLVINEDYFAQLVRAEPELYAHYVTDENGAYVTDDLGNKIFDEAYDYTGTFREIQWKNKAITELYYPGSVFKVITSAMGLDSGLATVGTSYTCSGAYTVADHTYNCAGRKSHGTQNMADALCNSCNIYYIQLGYKLGATRFYDYFNAFGFTSSTGVDLPYEMKTSSHYNASQLEGATELASSAFGQSMAVTPLQMCTALAACVNGGYLVTPYLVDQVVDASGNVIQQTQTTVKRQVLSETVSADLRYIMEYEVGSGADTAGGRNAYVAGYSIGGKSGTSEQLNMDRREDGDYKKVASFAAVLPADDPEILVYVMLDDPNNANTDYSSMLAAPVVGNIISEVAPYLGIATNGQDLTQTTVKVPRLVGTEWSNAQVELNKKGLKHRLVETGADNTGAPVTYQYPAAGTEVPGGTTVYLYTEGSGGKAVTVPGVEGKTASFAQQMLWAAGLNCVVEGDADGVVTAQSVPNGESVEMGTVITVTCAAAAE